MKNLTSNESDLIEKELQKLLSSERFRSSQVLSMFLQYVVEQTLAGHEKEIKEYTIGIHALGRPTDFNPQIDAVVRIHAGRLRRLLNEYYREEGSGDSVIVTIPKGSYVPFFEVRKPGETDYVNPSVNVSNGIFNGNGQDKPSYRKTTLAVFPFCNLSEDQSKVIFIDSFCEQLSIDIAKFEYISVSSYFLMCKYMDELNNDKKTIREMLGVDYALAGSIRFADNVIQINIQFMSGDTGALLWTHTYVYHDSSDLFTLQEEVINQVINKIADADGVITRNINNEPLQKRRNVFGAYEAVYSYYSFREQYDHNTYQQARSTLEEAVTSIPNSALIWSMLANLYINNFIFQFEKSAGDLDKGKFYAERALWLDSNCQYAFKALSWAYLLTGRKEECSGAIDQCLELNPKSPSIAGNMGFLMVCIGRYAEGYQLLLKSTQLNPVLPWYVNLGFALYYYKTGNYEEAVNWIQRINVINCHLELVVRIAATRKAKEIGKHHAAASAELMETGAGIFEEANYIINQFIYEEALRKSLLDGLAFLP